MFCFLQEDLEKSLTRASRQQNRLNPALKPGDIQVFVISSFLSIHNFRTLILKCMLFVYFPKGCSFWRNCQRDEGKNSKKNNTHHNKIVGSLGITSFGFDIAGKRNIKLGRHCVYTPWFRGFNRRRNQGVEISLEHRKTPNQLCFSPFSYFRSDMLYDFMYVNSLVIKPYRLLMYIFLLLSSTCCCYVRQYLT